MKNMNAIDSPGRSDGRRACAVPTKCNTPRGRSFEEMMSSSWQEFVIRYDVGTGRYVTRTACCAGAPVFY